DRQWAGEALPPDNLPAAGEHHALDAALSRRFEDVVYTDDIVGQQLGEEVIVVGRRGEVYQCLRSARRAFERRGVAQFAHNALAAAGRRFQIEAANAPTATGQLANHGLADPPG